MAHRSLTDRTGPLLGQLVTLAAILGCLRLTAFADPKMPRALTGQAVTLLSWLPPLIRYDTGLFSFLQVVVPIAGVLWLLQIGVPWSSWAMAIGYTALIALHEERRTDLDHMFVLSNQVLLAAALWYHLARREIRVGLEAGTFWHAPACPRWFPVLVAVQIGCFYSWAGVMKLWDSGLAWPNGASLQLWTYIWGLPDSGLTQAILHNRDLARLLQNGSLLGETLALPALLWRPLRWLVASLLIGFHVGQELVFGWPFGANAFLIALLYLPVQQGITRVVRSFRFAPVPMPEPGWRRWIIARTDIVGRYRLSSPTP